MLVADPEKRIKAVEALQHPYLQQQMHINNEKNMNSPCLTSATNKVKKVWN